VTSIRTAAAVALSVAVAVTVAGVAVAAPAEATTTVSGVVQELVVEDPHGDRHGEVRKVLRVGTSIVELAPDSLPTAANGDKVTARLARAAGGAQRVLSARTIAAAAAEPADPAVHDVHVAMVAPAGIAPDPAVTADSVTAALVRASDYWAGQTAGAVRFRVAGVLPWYTSAHSCADGVESMWEEALGKITIPPASDQHLLIVAPAQAAGQGCGYGLGSVGTWPGYPGVAFGADVNQSLFAHELGHNLGLHHSGALHCDGQDARFTRDAGNRVVWPASCHREEYGDLLDVMGYSGERYGEGNLNAVHMDQMGNTPSAVQTITTDGTHTVRLAPLSADVASLRAVKIVDGEGSAYYVEYRTGSGRDTVAPSIGAALGVRVLRQDPARTISSALVLDATPTGPSRSNGSWFEHDYDNSLAAGRTFTSAAGTVTVTVDSADAAGAALTIVRGEVPSVPAAVTLSGLPRRVPVGAAVTAYATVRNAVGTPVPGWAVHLQSLPGGVTAYRTVRTVTTDARGIASFRFRHTLGATYRYVAAAGAGTPATASNRVTVSAQALVSLRRPASAIRRNGSVATAGAVSAVPGAVVYVQTRYGLGAWVSVARAAVRGTAVKGSVRLTRRGSYQVRYYVRGGSGARYLGAYSTVYTVRAV
jgi:hypothetical protein